MVELNLTKRQQEIFDYVKRYGAEHGYPPTVRDIGKAIGLTSSSTVHAHLANLEKLGPAADPTKPRAIEVLVDKAKAAVVPSGLPVVGQVAAGQPVLAEENIEEYVPVPPIAGGDEGEFVLRVTGDSMINAGIFEGDYVVVRPQDTATDGEIVVALVGEEATVKRFYREDDHVRLQPENDALAPILSRDVKVLGGRCAGGCHDPRAARRTRAVVCRVRPRDPRWRPRDLEERLGRTWRALEIYGVAECPLCRSRMSKAGPVGECTSCGTRLS